MDSGLLLILSFFAFGMGACIASFLNVVIWRVPRGESIVSPPSHCPKCGTAIRWHQNVPILSWLALRGRCANCRAPISPRYVLVELLGGCLFLAAFYKWGFVLVGDEPLWCPPVRLVFMWIWISLMIVGSMIDFDHKLLPDFVTVGGMVLGVAFHGVRSVSAFFVSPSPSAHSLIRSSDYSVSSFLHSAIRSFDYSIISTSLLGLAFGFGLLWLVRFLGSKAFGREAMGMGDVFLMGAVGALFGPVAVLVTLILSSLVGSVVGLSMVALAKTRLGRFVEIPYGPYICLGCLVWMCWCPGLVSGYLRLLGF